MPMMRVVVAVVMVLRLASMDGLEPNRVRRGRDGRVRVYHQRVEHVRWVESEPVRDETCMHAGEQGCRR